MMQLLWLVPALPFAGFLALAVLSTAAGARLSRRAAAAIGCGSVGLSALLALLIALAFLTSPPAGGRFTQTLWTWMDVAGFKPGIAFSLDALAVVYLLVITFVGFLIHVYSAEFMARRQHGDGGAPEEGYARFFAYMNLFVGSMLTLVLADNLLLLYLGWEGVGLCSYLLIGFWYKDPANGRAARKAFVVTRVGDTALAVGLFLLFANLGTLRIADVLQAAQQQWAPGSALAVAAAALLLGGAVGKSAQLPLQVWLPDAMAGPSPVSALIHAATMVTAGVYLIARTHVLFSLAPQVMAAVAIVGALTLLVAGLSALTQRDIKRVLAYSTISQIGYMFLALGVGAWSAAVFHFFTHAFFKALLFLSAGAVILAQDDEHDMFKMGGLRKPLPVLFWTFLAGAASLAALPLVTAGFYSKDAILLQAWAAPQGSPWLWAAGLVGAFVTALYAFRMVYVTFYGRQQIEVSYRPRPAITVPLVVLAVLSIVGGFVELPRTLGNLPLFADFLHTVLPAAEGEAPLGVELALQIVTAAVALAGVGLAYLAYRRRPQLAARAAASGAGRALHRFWAAGWGFDGLYHTLFVRPIVWLARVNKGDVVDLLYRGVAAAGQELNGLLAQTQTGQVRWYALGIALGAVLAIALVVFL